MTVQECYAQMGANYNEVLERLGKEERVAKFLRLFLEDESYLKLCKSVQEKDYAEALEHAHNLKGVALNLGLTQFYEVSNALCEEFRTGNDTQKVEKLLKKMIETHEKAVEIVQKL